MINLKIILQRSSNINWKSVAYNYFFFPFNSQQFTNMQVLTSKPFEILTPFGTKVDTPARGPQWPKQEMVKYSVFLAFYLNISGVCQETDFNSWTFFRRLSIFVQTKNPNQCRIYHKKMMNDHPSINSLVGQLKGSIQKFQEWYNHYESSLNNLRINLLREKESFMKVEKQKSTNQVQLISTNVEPEMREQIGDKKLQELGPTDVGYNEPETVPKTSSYFAPKVQRPSFNFFSVEDQEEDNYGLEFMGKKRSGSLMEMIPGRKSLNAEQRDEKWKDCQSSFMDYIGKLNTLMSGH